ncbi:MAG: sulfatase [Bryobacterales bacterium]|nr:sulfatase [Bryobacterales bacterium]
MTRRTFLTTTLAAAAHAAPAKRNVLFIAVDDLRPQLGCYGDRFARTPYIDSIAAKGVVFDRAYCQQALCGPSRASLLTGLRPDTIRVYDLKTPFRDTRPNAVTLPQLFLNNGYHTENIGKIFHGETIMNDRASWSVPERLHMVTKRNQYALAKNQPAEDWVKTVATERADVPDNDYIDGKVADDAVATLERLRKQPFFLGVGITKPHLPFTAPSKYWDLFDRRELPLSANPDPARNAATHAIPSYSELRSYADFPKEGPIPEAKMREAMHGYYAATAFADACIGRILTALRKLGLAENTVIAVWGDHGWHLGEHGHWGKSTNFEAATRAPLIVSAPGTARNGTHSQRLVELVDIYPTLAELAALKPPPDLEGESFVPLLRQPGKPTWKKAAFSQYPRPAQQPKPQSTDSILKQGIMGYTMRTETMRYTEWRQDARVLETELYDHRRDPNETVNVAAQLTYKDPLTAMQKQMQAGWQGARYAR